MLRSLEVMGSAFGTETSDSDLRLFVTFICPSRQLSGCLKLGYNCFFSGSLFNRHLTICYVVEGTTALLHKYNGKKVLCLLKISINTHYIWQFLVWGKTYVIVKQSSTTFQTRKSCQKELVVLGCTFMGNCLEIYCPQSASKVNLCFFFISYLRSVLQKPILFTPPLLNANINNVIFFKALKLYFELLQWVCSFYGLFLGI
jgi:hypothetical protein